MKDVAVEGSKNFDHQRLLNVCLNSSTQASNIFTSIENAATMAGI